jgi:hypothetical protein
MKRARGSAAGSASRWFECIEEGQSLDLASARYLAVSAEADEAEDLFQFRCRLSEGAMIVRMGCISG